MTTFPFSFSCLSFLSFSFCSSPVKLKRYWYTIWLAFKTFLAFYWLFLSLAGIGNHSYYISIYWYTLSRRILTSLEIWIYLPGVTLFSIVFVYRDFVSPLSYLSSLCLSLSLDLLFTFFGTCPEAPCVLIWLILPKLSLATALIDLVGSI